MNSWREDHWLERVNRSGNDDAWPQRQGWKAAKMVIMFFSRSRAFEFIVASLSRRIAAACSRRHRSRRFCDGFFRRAGRQSDRSQQGLTMSAAFLSHIDSELEGLKSAGLYKSERVITSKQAGEIEVGRRKGAEFLRQQLSRPRQQCELASAAKAALDRYGYGMASVRFICGTQEEHKQLEATHLRLPRHGRHDPVRSCFDANGGLFETLLGDEDAIISDALNHASIIDGVRLSQGQALPLCQQRHGRSRGATEGGRRLPLPDDRHRRRVLHGRHHRQSQGRLRPRRQI